MMTDFVFLKRICTNKTYWLGIVATLTLLLCAIVHKDDLSGKTYTFLSLIYDEQAMTVLQNGRISLYNIFLRYDSGYLWMFCPIIASIPCVITKKNERFVLFRMSKTRYVIGKYVSNLLAAGAILLIAYFVYMSIGMVLIRKNIWDIHLVKKLLSVFIWGIMSSLPATLLVEVVQNRYLILCIPFVINYFLTMFIAPILPYSISGYVLPVSYQSALLLPMNKMIKYGAFLAGALILCGIMKKLVQERRCDCG